MTDLNRQLDQDALAAATTAAVDVLKRFHTASPGHLPKGLPKSVTQKLAYAAIAAWIIRRSEQAKQIDRLDAVEALILGLEPGAPRPVAPSYSDAEVDRLLAAEAHPLFQPSEFAGRHDDLDDPLPLELGASLDDLLA